MATAPETLTKEQADAQTTYHLQNARSYYEGVIKALQDQALLHQKTALEPTSGHHHHHQLHLQHHRQQPLPVPIVDTQPTTMHIYQKQSEITGKQAVLKTDITPLVEYELPKPSIPGLAERGGFTDMFDARLWFDTAAWMGRLQWVQFIHGELISWVRTYAAGTKEELGLLDSVYNFTTLASSIETQPILVARSLTSILATLYGLPRPKNEVRRNFRESHFFRNMQAHLRQRITNAAPKREREDTD